MSERPAILDEMREQFRAAAARELHAEARPRRQRWARPMAIVAVAIVGAGGGVALATRLISVGKPRHEPEQRNQRYDVPGGGGTIAVTATDKRQPLPWGVLVYRSSAGDTCAAVGLVRGAQLGDVANGRFRPFGHPFGGPCGDLNDAPYFVEVRNLNGRFVVFGRARRGVRTMLARRRGGEERRAAVGVGGAFLFVYSGDVKSSDIHLVALDRAGRPQSSGGR